MGEVYRATDTVLGRSVAIKILPQSFASDPERLARFEHEAKTLASLNHSNIAQIYGFEKAGDIPALIMELVEGPTLAERLAAGAMPIGEAIEVAKQIADGAGSGAREGDRSPRSEARQREDHAARRGQDSRLRSRGSDSHFPTRGRERDSLSHARAGHERRPHHGHCCVHVTRTGKRQTSR
jgi:serine/threonine protein kinase